MINKDINQDKLIISYKKTEKLDSWKLDLDKPSHQTNNIKTNTYFVGWYI